MISVSYTNCIVKVHKSGQVVWSKPCTSYEHMLEVYEAVMLYIRGFK